MKRLPIAIAALLSLMVVSLPALEVKEGRIRLSVDERSGRFSLSWLSDPLKGVWVPLFYDQETRTSYASIVVDGKAARLGDASEYRVGVSRDGANVVVEYRSALLSIRQTFLPIAPSGSTVAEGVAITWAVENIGAKDALVGLRFLLDTNLGERSGTHFQLSSGAAVAAESALEGAFEETRVVSPGSAGASLQVLLSGARVDKPDRVVMANWKRLDDAPWLPELSKGRSFTLLPYSINDSALAIFHEGKLLRRGEIRSYRSVLGAGAMADFSGGVAALSSFELPPLDPGADRRAAMQADLSAVRSLLEAIDAQLSSPQADPDETARIAALIERLRARRRSY